MTIYVVNQGDTLWDIARRYGVSVESIVELNGLEELSYLVVGQALVLPTTEFSYRVEQGDSLWSIAQRFNTTVNQIASLNNISTPNLIFPGAILRIPQPYKNYGYIETNAYIESVNAETDARLTNQAAPYLSYISLFSYQVSDDASLRDINDASIREAARNHRTAPLMTITNFRYGNFDTELVDNILYSEELQQTLINNMINVMREKNFYGVNIDFERITPENRYLYNNFLRRVMAALSPLGYSVSTALAPKPADYLTGAWHGAHDYRAHGEIVDFVIIMTYEWGWSGGPPFAVAPLNLVEEVIKYAVSVIPANKIMMGMPLYGYDWRLPYVEGGPWARRVSPQQALVLAAEHGQSIQYDPISQAPFFNYFDNGVEHEVWFEDARSVQAKLLLVNEYGLRGVSYWVLGVDFPQNWAVLDNMFNIVKLLP
jgi:spore germination protein